MKPVNLLSGTGGGQKAVGGTAVTDKLQLQGTSANGTAGSSAVEILVGNNGTTVAATVLNNGNVGIGTTNPTARLQLPAGGTAAGTAPLKLTTQTAPLAAVEQGTFELVGNSLQFSQLVKRRGVAMSQSVRTADLVVLYNDTNALQETEAYISSATIAGCILTVNTLTGYVFPGQHLRGTGVSSNTYIMAQLTGSTGVAGTYVLNTPSTVASPVAMSAALIIAEHGANYFEVGKCEEIILRGKIGQRNNAAVQHIIYVEYAGANVGTISTPLGTGIGAANAPLPYELRIMTTCRGAGVAVVTASITLTLMTVTGVTSGALSVGQTLSGAGGGGVTAGTTIIGLGAVASTYYVSVSQTVTSTTISATGTLAINGMLTVEGSSTVAVLTNVVAIDTTTAQNTIIASKLVDAGATNFDYFSVSQGRVLCIEPNR